MNHLRKHELILLAFIVGVLFRLLSGLQGIDAVDAGFNLTFFQHIFDRPDAMPYYFCYYLTGLVGGSWQWAFGAWGLLGFRLLEVLTMSAAVLLVYQSFKPWLPSGKLAAAAVVLSFLFPAFVIVFHYNTLTFLLLSASAWCLSQWAQRGAPGWLLASGYLVGLCFFARLVNVSMAALCVVPFVVGCRTTLKRGLALGALYACGMLTGVASVVALLLATNQWSYFQEGFSEAFGFFEGEGTSHTSGNLLGVYLKSWVNIGLQVAVLAAILYACDKLAQSTGRWRMVARALLMVVLFVLVWTSLPYLSAFAACVLVMVVAVVKGHLPAALKVMIGYVVLAASLFPLGSDIGVPGVFHWYAGLLLIPAACCIGQYGAMRRPALNYLFAFIFIAQFCKAAYKPYGEHQPRYAMTQQAVCGTLNAWTTPERASQYRHIVECIGKYETDHPYLLIGNQASELYYATQRLPFTSNTQMETYVGERLYAVLDRQQRRYGRLPLVVFLKRGHDIPSPDDYQASLHPWLQAYHYSVVYEDDDLKLMSTNKNKN